MREPKQRLTARPGVALGVSVILSGIAAPAMATPSALSRAADKRAAVAAQSAAIPEPEKQQTKNEALSFDPFAPSATPAVEPAAAAASAAAPQANINSIEHMNNAQASNNEAAKRAAARDEVLARLASRRPQFLVQIMRVRATRRSPNAPPAFTPRRPSDPPGPPDNLPPGPPTHAPPGRPPGVGR